MWSQEVITRTEKSGWIGREKEGRWGRDIELLDPAVPRDKIYSGL